MQNLQLNTFRCAISEQENDFHIFENPVALSCGHIICKSCIPNEINFECKICGKLNKYDLSEPETLSAINEVIDFKLSDLFQIIDARFREVFERFKPIKASFDELMNSKFDHVKEQVKARIDAIKIGLDELHEILIERINDTKLNFFRMNNIPETTLSEYEKRFNEFKRYVTKVKKKSIEKFYDHQRNLQHIEKAEKILLNVDTDFDVNFEPSDFIFDSQVVGKISSLYNNDESDRHLRCDVLKLNKELKGELSEKNEEIQFLLEENQTLGIEIENSNQRIYKHMKDIEGLNNTREALNKKLEKQNEQIEKINHDKQNLLSKLDEQASEIQRLNQENEDMNKTIMKRISEIELLNDENRHLLRVIEKKSDEIESLTSHNEDLSELINKKTKDIISLHHEKSTLSYVSIKQAKQIEFFDHLIKFPQSSILTLEELSKLSQICEFHKSKWKLIYRASTHSFSASGFHQKCNDINNTLTIIKTTNDFIFGGYTTQNWNNHGYKHDANAFLFSFKNKHNKQLKFKIKQPQYAIYCYQNYGPCFGGGREICISDNSDKNNYSYSNFPFSYFATDISPNDYFLAGSSNFTIKEIEVFHIE